MTSFVLRRLSSLAPRRTLAAIETVLHNHHQSTTGIILARRNGGLGDEVRSFSTIREPQSEGMFGIQARNFHVKSGQLGYRASSVLQAELAVDYSYEESSKKGADDEGLEISKLGISPEIVSSLAKKGITKLFPIQRAVLEPAMQGRDMIGRARTGTGKTLAFGIPILDKIIRYNAKHGRGRNPLALVLAPTRELAKQVDKEFYESAPNLDTICVYGGTPISAQMGQLGHGVDVAVGTPGRVIDLIKRGALDLSEVQFIVLDEADQMLQVGFQEDVEIILKSLPKKRQSLMFSATMPSWIRKLTQNYLKDPLTIDLVGESDQKLADGITLCSIASDTYAKASIIGPLITEHAKGGKCIVFTQTKRDADRLAYAMGRNNKCEALHGDISQSQRERTLSGFRDGRFNILVATDVASRGLDIPNVDLVIHYELPTNSEIFVHRSGRTGRAGKKGTAILIHTPDQTRSVKIIERDVGCKFNELPRIKVEGGDANMFGGIAGGSGRFGQYGGMKDRSSGDSFGRFGGYGGSGFGRSSGEFGSGFGGPSTNRAGKYGGSGSGRSDGFGDFGSSTRSSGRGGFGGSGRSSGFGDFGSSARSSGREGFGGSGRSSGFGEFGSGHTSGGFGNRGYGSSSYVSNPTRPF